MPKKSSLLKPSGYDVVIRNMLAVRKINRRIGKADPKTRDRLLVEKDRLMEEMWAACPHESVVRSDEVKTVWGPEPVPACFCTSCGLYEASPSRRFKALKPRAGRTIVLANGQIFSVNLGRTLLRTGINAKESS